MPSRTVPALQVVLALIFLLLLVGQIAVLPGAAADTAERYPEAAFLRWPVLLLAIATLACVQVAVVCVGKWLPTVSRQGVLDSAADRFINVFVAAVAAASGLVMVIGVYVSATTGSPLWVSCALLSLLGGGLALLVMAKADRLATLG
jgi:hypothetical protein